MEFLSEKFLWVQRYEFAFYLQSSGRNTPGLAHEI